MSFPALFERTRAAGRAAFLPYLMAGLPGPDASVELFGALDEAGADGFEIGLPYADPLMDGPVIQAAGAAAIGAGTTIDVGLRVAGEVVARFGKPCAVMTYANPILRLGIDRFCGRAADAGVSALIVADLPVDEAAPFVAGAARRGIGMVLFAAPTTSDARLQAVVEAGPVFIYGVAEMGVTGERAAASEWAAGMAARVRAVTGLPLAFGVGIATPQAAAEAAAVADGVIVGTALVRRVLEAPNPAAAARSLREAGAAFAASMMRRPGASQPV
ncbi:MAG: tryptophan synthase subunit alpha [Actinomycetota bacterium]|nr:tryptophan synthase subunit alpha [Actinomycetota bacterium]